MNSLVSVIIPCFNDAALVMESIQSCLRQTYRPIEVLVVDDGSSDSTRDDLSRWVETHRQVRLLTQTHSGPGAARNHGLQASHGEYIQWLDADDVLEPEKIASQARFLASEAAVDAVYSDFRVQVVDNGEKAASDFVCRVGRDDFLVEQIRGRGPSIHAVLMRRSAAGSVSWDEKLPAWEDRDYWVRQALAGCRFAYLETTPGAVYRIHPGRGRRDAHSREWIAAAHMLWSRCEAELREKNELTRVRRLALAGAYVNTAWRADRLGCSDVARAAMRRACLLTWQRAEIGEVESKLRLWPILGIRRSFAVHKTIAALKGKVRRGLWAANLREAAAWSGSRSKEPSRWGPSLKRRCGLPLWFRLPARGRQIGRDAKLIRMDSLRGNQGTVQVAVVVVSYQTRDWLRRCLEHLLDARRAVGGEVWVVDNASDDKSADMVAAEFPWVRLIRNSRNRGFAAAANQALRLINAPYILMLNSDVLLSPGSIERLLGVLQRYPHAALVGARLVGTDGRQQSYYGSFPRIWDVTIGRLSRKLRKRSNRAALAGQGPTELSAEGRAATERVVDWAPGACMLVRREAIREVGLLDERFFMYAEDVDWCRRFRRAGWLVLVDAGITVVHEGGASVAAYNDAVRSNLWLYESGRNLYLYFRKHHGAGTARLLQGFDIMVTSLALVGSASRLLGGGKGRDRSHVAAYSQRLRDACRGYPRSSGWSRRTNGSFEEKGLSDGL